MDNGTISKEQENALGNLQYIKEFKTSIKPDQQDICGKQETQNSPSVQNKFDLPSFKCDFCPYESIWKHAVKRHQQTHSRGQSIPEGTKKSKYECETCSYTTKNWAALKDHQKLHAPANRQVDVTQNEDLPKLCLTKLKEKQIEESKSKEELELCKTANYTCKKCKYKTNYGVIFESHLKMHLPTKGDEVFRCDLCNFFSVYRQSFLRHIKTMHERELSFEEHTHKGNMEEKLDHNVKTTMSSLSQKMDLNGDNIMQVAQGQHNTLLQNLNPVKSQKKILESIDKKSSTLMTDPTLKTSQLQKCVARTRRGKYSDVPVKTTKNGLFECEHCSYQTAIRTALVKHQTNHLKNANS